MAGRSNRLPADWDSTVAAECGMTVIASCDQSMFKVCLLHCSAVAAVSRSASRWYVRADNCLFVISIESSEHNGAYMQPHAKYHV